MANFGEMLPILGAHELNQLNNSINRFIQNPPFITRAIEYQYFYLDLIGAF